MGRISHPLEDAFTRLLDHPQYKYVACNVDEWINIVIGQLSNMIKKANTAVVHMRPHATTTSSIQALSSASLAGIQRGVPMTRGKTVLQHPSRKAEDLSLHYQQWMSSSHTFSSSLLYLRVVRRFNGCECLGRVSQFREFVLGFRTHLRSSVHVETSDRVRFNAEEGCGNVFSCLFLAVSTPKPWLILGCKVLSNGGCKLVYT